MGRAAWYDFFSVFPAQNPCPVYPVIGRSKQFRANLGAKAMVDRPQKITFAEMRESGVQQ